MVARGVGFVNDPSMTVDAVESNYCIEYLSRCACRLSSSYL